MHFSASYSTSTSRLISNLPPFKDSTSHFNIGSSPFMHLCRPLSLLRCKLRPIHRPYFQPFKDSTSHFSIGSSPFMHLCRPLSVLRCKLRPIHRPFVPLHSLFIAPNVNRLPLSMPSTLKRILVVLLRLPIAFLHLFVFL